MRKIQLILFAALTLGYTSCDYLDVVPKSKATENDIWKTPAEAKKFRFNMMQYMPVLRRRRLHVRPAKHLLLVPR